MIIAYEADTVNIGSIVITYQKLLEDCTFSDGSPCGKEVVE
jgi:hypothetical protein